MEAVQAVSHWYLDGKPQHIGKHSSVAAAQHAQFWSCNFLYTLTTKEFELTPFILALSRYMIQEKTANFKLLNLIAIEAPETFRKAIRCSGLVLRTDSKRWKEVEQLALNNPEEFKEFIRICNRFQDVYSSSKNDIKNCQKPLSELSPLELLSYASLYAFQYLLSDTDIYSKPTPEQNNKTQEIWYAINDILVWKLQNSTKDMFHLTEMKIAQSLKIHLSPFLFPSPDLPEDSDVLYQAFKNLISAQLEMNSFLSQSVDAFCYDDSTRFEFSDTQLIIKKLDPTSHKTWIFNGKKLTQLHMYWFYRAIDEFAVSEYATQLIGKQENHEANQLAIIKAMRTKLELSDVYGLNDFVTVKGGFRVDLFQALLSLELMTAFFSLDYLLPYQEHLKKTGHWQLALGELAMNGLLQGNQNRFPITWSERKAKARNIKGWTVNKKFPKGNIKTAEAIIDFWSTNLADLSTRLQNSQAAKVPELYERPFIEIADRLGQIRVEILMKTFSYSEYFPHSKKVAVFGHKEISNITITQAFDNMWDSIKPQKDKQTLKIYATHIKLHIKPGIGDIILRELRPKQVKDWIKSIDLSISSKNGILTPLRYLYSEAYSEGLVDENIMNRITNETRKRKKKNPLSIDEVDKLITHLERISQQAKHYHQFAIWTGLSSGEQLGLKWGDVNFRDCKVSIRRIIRSGEEKSTKNNYRNRTIELLYPALVALIELKPPTYDENPEQYRSQFVFINPNTNKVWRNDAINTFWKKSLQELNIKHRSPYETRHTFASIMVTACLPDGWVRNQMGHATMKMLEEVYAKWHGNTNIVIDWILKHTKNGTNGADFTKLFISQHKKNI